MSTKCSLVLVNWNTEEHIHIYMNLMNGKYYIQINKEQIIIPKKYAKIFATCLKEEEIKQDKEFNLLHK